MDFDPHGSTCTTVPRCHVPDTIEASDMPTNTIDLPLTARKVCFKLASMTLAA